jgi:putative tricarboxylic transport membrane protein
MIEYMKKRDAGFLVALVLLVLAAFVAKEAHDLGLGAVRSPGPGFVIFWTSVLLAVFSVRMLFSSLMGSGDGTDWEHGNFGSVASVIVSLLVYAFALERVGFVLTTFVFTTFSFWLLAEDRSQWLRILAGSLLATVISYIVFTRLFGLQLPKGWLTLF